MWATGRLAVTVLTPTIEIKIDVPSDNSADHRPRESRRPHVTLGVASLATADEALRRRSRIVPRALNIIDHPLAVYPREDAILPELDAWLATAPGRLRSRIKELVRTTP